MCQGSQGFASDLPVEPRNLCHSHQRCLGLHCAPLAATIFIQGHLETRDLDPETVQSTLAGAAWGARGSGYPVIGQRCI